MNCIEQYATSFQALTQNNLSREGNDLEEKERQSSWAGVEGLGSEAFVHNAFLMMMPSFGNALDDTR